jgi:hypothetical protein
MSNPDNLWRGERRSKMLNRFIGKVQLSIIMENCHREEGEFFRDMIGKLECQISAMPKTYETEGQGDEVKATLHYFDGQSDWYIIERDIDTDGEGQLQAFGFACLNGDTENAELGYVNIQELISFGVELDLYYVPETLTAIKARFKSRKIIQLN